MHELARTIPDATATVREDGTQATFQFANGYGASVIRHGTSYGSEDGLFELAVLDAFGHISYTTPITDDVLGGLTANEVTETLVKIADLP